MPFITPRQPKKPWFQGHQASHANIKFYQLRACEASFPGSFLQVFSPVYDPPLL